MRVRASLFSTTNIMPRNWKFMARVTNEREDWPTKTGSAHHFLHPPSTKSMIREFHLALYNAVEAGEIACLVAGDVQIHGYPTVPILYD